MPDVVMRGLAEAREGCPTTARPQLREGALLVDLRDAQATYEEMEWE